MTLKKLVFGLVITIVPSFLFCDAYAANPLPKDEFDISADLLEIQGNKHIGIFSGNVKVIRGEILLSSDVIKVHYAAQGKEVHKNNSTSKLSKIVIDTPVTIVSPTEKAMSKRGYYDATTQTLVLEGEVMLYQGNNVLKGSKLIYDYRTNKSRLLGGETQSIATDAPTKGRVRASFEIKKKEGNSNADN
jgi:lipopolysaccharide export system protein LptA